MTARGNIRPQGRARTGAGDTVADTCGLPIRSGDSTSAGRILLEKGVACQLGREFLGFYGIPSFIRGSQETATCQHPERHLRLFFQVVSFLEVSQPEFCAWMKWAAGVFLKFSHVTEGNSSLFPWADLEFLLWMRRLSSDVRCVQILSRVFFTCSGESWPYIVWIFICYW